MHHGLHRATAWPLLCAGTPLGPRARLGSPSQLPISSSHSGLPLVCQVPLITVPTSRDRPNNDNLMIFIACMP